MSEAISEVQARRRQPRVGTDRPTGKVRVGLFEHRDKWKDIYVLTLDVPKNARMCGKSSLRRLSADVFCCSE
jgi:hypothetical protein